MSIKKDLEIIHDRMEMSESKNFIKEEYLEHMITYAFGQDEDSKRLERVLMDDSSEYFEGFYKGKSFIGLYNLEYQAWVHMDAEKEPVELVKEQENEIKEYLEKNDFTVHMFDGIEIFGNCLTFVVVTKNLQFI